MMTKSKSKQIKQLKYLLLVPVLASMLFYTACSNEESTTEKKSVKQPIKVYVNKDGKVVEEPSSGYQSKYLDIFLGEGMPNVKEYSIEELTEEEKGEYLSLLKNFNEEGMPQLKIRVFEAENGRKMVAFEKPVFDKDSKLGKVNYQKSNNVPFSTLDKVPTFPGCTEGDKTCFNQSMAKFIQENFDAKFANKLNLPAGKKRIYVQFKINKEGNIIDINARAPHPELKAYAIEVAQKLPKMLPGEKDGKQVTTSYVLPITFVIE